MDSTQKLLNLREQIDTAKTNKAREEGKLDELGKRLATNFGIKSVAEAEKLLSKYKKELGDKQAQMERGLQELESDYEWN